LGLRIGLPTNSAKFLLHENTPLEPIDWAALVAPPSSARFIRFIPPRQRGKNINPAAIPAALRLAGLKQDAIDWIELNEAFAAQAVAVMQELQLDPAKVNPLGGAIALGHPLGATGAIRSATAIHALHRRNLKYSMVTMCVGTGMGAAGIFERC
jgi:acetyl-CoA acyltransferase